MQTHHPTAVTLTDLAEHFRSSPRRLCQQLRGDLDVIVHTALQKQAARRYATAEAFAQDIQHHLARKPIAAQPDSRWYRAQKYVQRHAWALTAVGAVVAALSVGLGVALWQELMASTSTPVNLLADLHAIELQRITLNMQISLLHTLGRQAQECASKAAAAEDAYLRRLKSTPPALRDR